MYGPRIVLRKSRTLVGILTRRALFRVFQWILPVRDDHWCFASWDRHDHTLDNPRAVFEAVKDDPSLVKIVLQRTRGGPPEVTDGRNVRFVHVESFAAVYYLAVSRVLLIGYALSILTSYIRGLDSKHLVVQLWHGSPLRKVGRLLPGDEEPWWDWETPKYRAMVASSEAERSRLAAAFAPLPEDQIWITGLPRTDLFLGEEDHLPHDFRNDLARVRELTQGRRLVLYAPTWRDSEAQQYFFDDREQERLVRLLRRHDAVLGVRGHSNVRHYDGYGVERVHPEIVSLDDLPDVNIILRETAVLITDYSSIFFDFVLTGRPIIHFTYDFDEYQPSKGFLYEVDEAMPGPLAMDFDQLATELDTALTDGLVDEVRYGRVRDTFHEHNGSASINVVARIREQVRPSPRS